MRNHKRAWKNRRTHRRIQHYKLRRRSEITAEYARSLGMMAIADPLCWIDEYLICLWKFESLTPYDLAAL